MTMVGLGTGSLQPKSVGLAERSAAHGVVLHSSSEQDRVNDCDMVDEHSS